MSLNKAMDKRIKMKHESTESDVNEPNEFASLAAENPQRLLKMIKTTLFINDIDSAVTFINNLNESMDKAKND